MRLDRPAFTILYLLYLFFGKLAMLRNLNSHRQLNDMLSSLNHYSGMKMRG
jgi:hypothetical protein